MLTEEILDESIMTSWQVSAFDNSFDKYIQFNSIQTKEFKWFLFQLLQTIVLNIFTLTLLIFVNGALFLYGCDT